jgi:polysaccharide pyruvyl transferase WcaK-like protein
LIISTRFHGAMLALQQSVPFIAIDQITGGAKVSKLIGRSGWPHCFRVDDLDKRQLMRSAEALLAGRDAELLRKVRRSTVQRANATLARLDGVLEDIGGRGNVAC